MAAAVATALRFTAYRVVRSGQSELLPEITDEMIDAGTPDLEQRRMAPGARASGPRWWFRLIVGQKPFGAVSFITAESGRRYGTQDLLLASEIARARLAGGRERSRLHRDARRRSQTRDNFLAIASHELRTPLSALTVLDDVAGARAPTRTACSSSAPTALKDRMLKAERQTRQLARLVDRLLDVSRLSTPRSAPRARADRPRGGRARRDLALRRRGGGGGQPDRADSRGPTVGFWDRSRIDQVLTNLVGNALKYGAGAPVTVSVSAGGSGHVRLIVRDGGPGIPAEHQERIFGQFERATASEKLAGDGAGALAGPAHRHRTRRHGDAGQQPGTGALHVSPTRHTIRRTPEQQLDDACLNTSWSSKTTRTCARACATRYARGLSTSSPRSTAKRRCTHLNTGARPCVILLDLMMPVMDGWTFHRELAKDQTLASIPVVVMTAAAPARATAVDASTVLYKPLQMDTVVEVVQEHCPGGAA